MWPILVADRMSCWLRQQFPPVTIFCLTDPHPGGTPFLAWVPHRPLHRVPHKQAASALRRVVISSYGQAAQGLDWLGGTSESQSAGDEGAACRGASNDRCKPGGQPGPANALKHGRRTAEAQRKRKLVQASLKALHHLLNSKRMVSRMEGKTTASSYSAGSDGSADRG